MSLDEFREDIPVELIGGKRPPNEKASAMSNHVGEKLHVQEILMEDKIVQQFSLIIRWFPNEQLDFVLFFSNILPTSLSLKPNG